jgi:lantibiotic biosynthesis protein
MQGSANSYIEKIDRIIGNYEPVGIGIMDGKGARLLYYYELFRATGNPAYKVSMKSALEELLSEVKKHSGQADSTLLSGMTGVLWLFYELNTDGVDGEFGDTNNMIEQLAGNAVLLLENNKSGYLDNAYGILYYLLLCEQTQAVKGQAGRILQSITARYAKGDIYHTFCSNNHTQEGNDELNLGLFYGLCGNLLVLIKACQLGYNREHVLLEKLLKDGVSFILHHKIDIDYEDECYSFFPPAAKKGSNFVETSNTLAWFCSDLNHVLLLYEMTLLTGDMHYREVADYIGLQTIARKNFKETEVDSSLLFNGCSGIALFYKKLSGYSNREEYLGAAYYWMQKTMMYLDKEVNKPTFTAAELGVLNGLAGVSLSILYYYHEVQPKWTKLFFL